MSKIKLGDYLAVALDTDTELYHGIYYKYKPSPSGFPRFILTASTLKGYKTPKLAALAIEKLFPHLEKVKF